MCSSLVKPLRPPDRLLLMKLLVDFETIQPADVEDVCNSPQDLFAGEEGAVLWRDRQSVSHREDLLSHHQSARQQQDAEAGGWSSANQQQESHPDICSILSVSILLYSVSFCFILLVTGGKAPSLHLH